MAVKREIREVEAQLDAAEADAASARGVGEEVEGPRAGRMRHASEPR